MAGPIISSFEVVEIEPGERIRMRTTVGTMHLDITRQVAPNADTGTTVAATVRGSPTGFLRLFDPLMKLMVGRSVRADYRRLQEIIDVDTETNRSR